MYAYPADAHLQDLEENVRREFLERGRVQSSSPRRVPVPGLAVEEPLHVRSYTDPKTDARVHPAP